MQPRKGSIPRGRSGPGRAVPGRAGPSPAGGASCGRGGAVQHRGERRGRCRRYRRCRPVRRGSGGSAPPGRARLASPRLGSVRYGTERYGWVRPGGGPAEPRLRPLQRRAAPLRSLPRPRGRRDGAGSGPPPSTAPLSASVSPSRPSRPRRDHGTALPGAARTTGGPTPSREQPWGTAAGTCHRQGVTRPPGAKFRGQRSLWN